MNTDQVAARLKSIDVTVRALGAVIEEVREYFDDNKCLSDELIRRLYEAKSALERLVSLS